MATPSNSSYLYLLYKSLRIAMQAREKQKNPSLLLSALEMKSNARLDLLTKSAIGESLLTADELDELVKKGLIMESAHPRRYTLTGRGIWHVETENGVLNESVMVDYLDNKFFPKAAKIPGLNEKEKVIVLGLAAARCFGADQAIDLHRSDDVRERWMQIFLACYDVLQVVGLVTKLKRGDVFGKSGNEHPVSNLVRHTDSLPKKTRGIYKALGNQQYCLEVVARGEIDAEALAYVYRLILGDALDRSALLKIAEVAQKIANDDCIFIYDLNDVRFFGSQPDDVVRTVILSLDE